MFCYSLLIFSTLIFQEHLINMSKSLDPDKDLHYQQMTDFVASKERVIVFHNICSRCHYTVADPEGVQGVSSNPL